MKVNGKGRECPVWCRVDHEAEAETEIDRSCYGQEHTVKAEPSVAGAEAGSRSGALVVPSAWPRPWKPQ